MIDFALPLTPSRNKGTDGPSLAEINRLTADIRSRWTQEQRRRRRGSIKLARLVEILSFRANHRVMA